MKEQPVINIAFASDKPLLLDGTKVFLEAFDNLLLTIEAVSGQTLFNLIENAGIKPEICMLDINMADLKRYNIIARIKLHWPDIKILALSIFQNDSTVEAILQKGISGYLPHAIYCLQIHRTGKNESGSKGIL